MREKISQLFPDAIPLTLFSGRHTYQIPTSTPVSTIFDVLKREANELGIEDWGVGQVALDDVFHKIIHEASRALQDEI